MEPIIEALKQFLGEYVVAAAVLLIALMIFVWWLSKKYNLMKNKIDNLPCADHTDQLNRFQEESRRRDELMARIESKLETLPCTLHSEKHDKHAERLSKSEALLHKMEGQLELLVNASIEKNTAKIRNRSSQAFSSKHSPRVLNENGISLLNDFGGKEFLDKNMDIFIAKIEKFQPKTPLDVENYALAVLQTSTVDDIFNPIKNWVYNAPIRSIKNPDGSTSEKEVTLDDVIFVLSLPIRDAYLEKHPI